MLGCRTATLDGCESNHRNCIGLVLFFPPIGERKQGTKNDGFHSTAMLKSATCIGLFNEFCSVAAPMAVVNHVRLTVHVESRSYLAVEAAKNANKKSLLFFDLCKLLEPKFRKNLLGYYIV